MKTPLRLTSMTSSKSLSDMSRKSAVRTMPAHPNLPAQATCSMSKAPRLMQADLDLILTHGAALISEITGRCLA